jgi:hypothetical protein
MAPVDAYVHADIAPASMIVPPTPQDWVQGFYHVFYAAVSLYASRHFSDFAIQGFQGFRSDCPASSGEVKSQKVKACLEGCHDSLFLIEGQLQSP